MFLFIDYPSWIHPELFPNIPILGLLRWYGLMYVFAFMTAYIILNKQFRRGELDSGNKKATEDEMFNFLAFGIVFLIIGARVFSALVYDTTNLYRKKPYLIFWPFDPLTHAFTGLAGMSYHGGVIGGFLGTVIWLLRRKKNVFQWMDAMALAIPAGYTFGRIGNFMNGELYGRITTVPWGMIFPSAEKFSASLEWVQDFASSINLPITSALVNLPRHPSQLYEAFFEGIVLFLLLLLVKKVKKWHGEISACYVIGYGVFRFFLEYFREPDIDLGFRIGDTSAPIYLNTSLTNISTGQVLCLIMIVFGISLGIFSYVKNRKRPL